MEMRWGIVQWRLHVYGWVIYELDGFGSEENQQQTKCGLLPTWVWVWVWVTGRALDLSCSRLPVLYSRDGGMDGRIKGRRDYQSRGMDRILFPQSLRLDGR